METPTQPTPELQQKIIEWLELAGNATAELVKTEIPPIIQEYLYWKFFENLLSASFCLVPVILGLVWFIFYSKKVFKKCLEADRVSKGETFWTIIPAIVSIASALLIFFQFPGKEIKNMVYIKIAPKVYLIDQVGQFIKQ